MRIAIVGQKRIPSLEGGVEVVVEELATRMAMRGHEVVCFNRKGHHVSGKQFDADKPAQWKGVKIHYVPTIPRRGLAAVTSSFFGCLYAAFGKFDVVHIHAEGPAAFSWIPRLLGKKVVFTVHGLDWARSKWKGGIGSIYIRVGEWVGVHCAHEIIVLNRANQRYFKQTYGRDTHFIPNGVERAVPVEPLEIREKYQLEKGSYILYLGRIVPEKGEHYLIKAYKKLHTDKKLVIAGGGSDAWRYENEIIKMAADNDNIIFTGFVYGRRREELYSNAYFYVLPSDLEGMPLSLLEAMSYGNCVLTSDIDECSTIVEDKGVTFHKADVDDLAEKMQMLCDDEKLVERYKENVADYICKKYQWDNIVEQILELYRR